MTNVFSAYAHLSAGLFGILLLAVMMGAPSGLVGGFVKWAEARKLRRAAADVPARVEEQRA
jgi:branched-chain amino acid transport system permease protein